LSHCFGTGIDAGVADPHFCHDFSDGKITQAADTEAGNIGLQLARG